MKILLVNDDGYQAEGINVLEKTLLEHGNHEIWVCAPDSQRSASSHAINVHRSVTIKEVSPRHYTCSGFPADCTLYSLAGAIPVGTPDLLISGINHGFNVAADLLYSGTAGAAAEGAMHGIPSIALSCAAPVWGRFPFQDTADFVVKHLEELVASYTPGTFININVPENANGQWIVGIPGEIEYYDNILKDEGDGVFSMNGEYANSIRGSETDNTDFSIVKRRSLISVGTVQVYPVTKEDAQNRLRELLKK